MGDYQYAITVLQLGFYRICSVFFYHTHLPKPGNGALGANHPSIFFLSF